MRTTLPIALLLFSLACGGAETTAETTPVADPPAPLTNPPPEEPADTSDEGLVIGDDLCDSDADCVPAECCHAAACVSQDHAPSCQDAMCTQECRYGTLDCGGSCLCHDGRCAARLSAPPAGVLEAIGAQ